MSQLSPAPRARRHPARRPHRQAVLLPPRALRRHPAPRALLRAPRAARASVSNRCAIPPTIFH